MTNSKPSSSQNSNKADLVILNDIRGQLKSKSRPALALPGPPSRHSSNSNGTDHQDGGKKGRRPSPSPIARLRRVGIAVRFVVRMQLAARGWAQHERTRRRLAEAAGEMEKQERIRRMRDEWRAQMRVAVDGGS